MHAAAALTWAFAGLLGVAGVAKLTRPSAAGAALQGAKLPSAAWVVRVLGAGEVGVAVAVLALGGRITAALVALAYAVFAVFALRQSRRGEGCGCFGESDAPATRLHVGVDVVGAGAAATAAVMGAPTPFTVVGGNPTHMAVVTGLIVLGVVMLRLALTGMPELTAALALHTAEAER